MKNVEAVKSIKGNLKRALWTAATTILATNQALSMRAQKAEGNTPVAEGDNNEADLRYEISRLQSSSANGPSQRDKSPVGQRRRREKKEAERKRGGM
jgi:hypothetical protein